MYGVGLHEGYGIVSFILDSEERHNWMRKQHFDIDEGPIPDEISTSVHIEGIAHPAELYREGEDWVAVIEIDPALIEIGSHRVPIDHLALGPVTDLTTYAHGPPNLALLLETIAARNRKNRSGGADPVRSPLCAVSPVIS
jgi:hypothetical protein